MPVVTPIGPCFAAEVEGIDVTRPPAPDEVAAVHAGMDRYAVLAAPGRPDRSARHLPAAIHSEPTSAAST